MKVTSNKVVPTFDPVSITITLTTAKEVMLLHKIMRATIRVPDMLINDKEILSSDGAEIVKIMTTLARELVQYL